MNRIILGAAAIAIAVPAMAQVQAPLAPVAPRMEMTQSRDQIVAKVRDHFARMDVNRDGFVAGDEMKSMRANRQGMKRANRQALRDPSAAFDRLDTNRNGVISREEFAKAREVRMERRIVRNGAPGAAGTAVGGHHQGMAKMHRMGGGRMRGGMMRMADLDKDGRVSLQEATTSALQRFDRVDSNRDGRITPDERRLHREQRRQLRAPKAG